jgi:hypothetical protein
MPKKSRHAKAKQRAKMAKAAEQVQPQQPTAIPTKLQSPAQLSQKAQAPKAQDLASRYGYVVPEAKRIGIIAGSIILVLIILSFVLG